ncbi:hypothetical protein BHM03_00059011, partial [Ensete ventricosum]
MKGIQGRSFSSYSNLRKTEERTHHHHQETKPERSHIGARRLREGIQASPRVMERADLVGVEGYGVSFLIAVVGGVRRNSCDPKAEQQQRHHSRQIHRFPPHPFPFNPRNGTKEIRAQVVRRERRKKE